MYTFINWEDIEVKGSRSGVKKTTCPNCSHTRKKKKDPCLYVNFESGVAKCYNCDALGFKEDLKSKNEYNYTLPPQVVESCLKLSENLLNHYLKRGITKQTLEYFRVSEEFYYQPALNKTVNNIVFNYYEGDILVNKKYKSGNKKFTQTKNGKPIFYNLNAIIGQKEAYIVEGEEEVMCYYQIGIKNVISLPNGANNNDNFWVNSEKYLKDIEKFYIATDNDDKGDAVAELIAQRLGRYRCERVRYTNKDANDDYLAGVLEQSINNIEVYPVKGTIKHSDLESEMLELQSQGLPKVIKPNDANFSKTNQIFSVMRGHLVTITGIPSHGKSNFTEWYVLNLINDCNLKASIYSPEHHPTALHAMHLGQKAVGYSLFGARNKDTLLSYLEWANQKIYFTSPDNDQTPNWDWLFETMKEQMIKYGIDLFVIDAWNKVILDGKNELQETRKVLTKLTAFAQQNNVIIFLIAHPTKMPKDAQGNYVIPDLYSVSGSADFRNQTHDGFCIYRDFATDIVTFVNLKTKMSFQGKIGEKVEFKYDVSSGRYYEIESDLNKVSFVDNTVLMTIREEYRYEIPKLDPKKAFFDQDIFEEDDNDVPF